MKKRTLVLWSAVAFLGSLYWIANTHPSFVEGVALIGTTVLLGVLSVLWGE